MPMVELRFRPGAFQDWENAGLKLYGLRRSGVLSDSSVFEAPCSVLAEVTNSSWLSVGAFCSLSGGTIGNVRFGRYCSLAHGTVIGAHEHPIDWLTSSRTAYWPQVHGWDRFMAPERVDEISAKRIDYAKSCPITEIGNDVWIGQGAFIKVGITIGDGAVIGARATVVKDVPPYSVVVGTPGRVLKLRFPEPIVERLMAIQWWQYSIYDMSGVAFDDVAQALDQVETRVADGEIKPYQPTKVTLAELLAGPVPAATDRAA